MLMRELQRWRLIQLRLVRSVFPCGRPIIHVQARHELLSPSIPTPQTKWLHMEERLHIIHKYINLYVHMYVCMCTSHEHGLAAGCPREQIQNPDLFMCIYILHHGVLCYLQRARTSIRVRSQAILFSFLLRAPLRPKSAHWRPKLGSPHVCEAG